MSRGGRGGGRGGRGGGRGGRPALPWEDADEPDARPSELFPAYAVPTPGLLSTAEEQSVRHFLLLRRQIHSSPLYTSKRNSLADPTAPRKSYGRDQANAVYENVQPKASLDPFTAVPTYSQRFSRQERALPDWSARPVCREMYPAELVAVVDPSAAGGKRRKLELSRVDALPNAEEAFGMTGGDLLEKLKLLKDETGGADEEGAKGDEEEEEEEGGEEEEEDEIYDDEDAGDYDAEGYFDNGDDGGDDYGDDDGEGTY